MGLKEYDTRAIDVHRRIKTLKEYRKFLVNSKEKLELLIEDTDIEILKLEKEIESLSN